MACLLVPVAEAIVTTAVSHVLKVKDDKKNGGALSLHKNDVGEFEKRQPFYKKLSWLSKLLWGGSALLAFEHIWHGEIVPWYPFLTAAQSAEDTAVMLREMSTVGVTMAAIVTAVWAGMLIVSKIVENKSKTHSSSAALELKNGQEAQI